MSDLARLKRSVVSRALVVFALTFTSVVALAATPTSAAAQPSKADEAKDRFQKGVDLFKEGDFQGSLVEFKRSYELVPNFNVLYNIGEVYFQMQDYASALKTLQQFEVDGGSRVTASKKTEVDKDIDKLKGRVAMVTINVNIAGADVYVDDTLIGKSPIKDAIMVSGGKRKFVASKDGYNPARESKEIAGAEKGDVTLTLTELQPGQQPVQITEPNNPNPQNPVVIPPGGNQQLPPPQPKKPSLVGPIIAFSATGAFAIAWGITGGLALSSDADLTKLKQTQTTHDALTSQANKAKTLALVSDVMMGATIAGAGVATVVTILTFTGSSKKTGSNGPTVAVKAGPFSAGLEGTF